MEILDYQAPARRKPLSAKAPLVASIAVVLPVLCSAGVAGFTLYHLWSVPPGVPVRPMALFFRIAVGGIAASLLCLTVSGAAIALAVGHRERRWLGVAGLATPLSVVPPAAGYGTVALLEQYHGLVLAG